MTPARRRVDRHHLVVTSAFSPPPTDATFRASARFLGIAQTIGVLALTILSARGLTQIAHRHLVTGIVTLAVALGARWLVTWGSNEWSDDAQQRIRDQWRRRLVEHLRRPLAEGSRARGDLSLAVDNASLAPALGLLEASAQASVLGLLLVFWAAGGLSTALIVVLLALAIPLYQRAGRRSAELEKEYRQRRALLESRQLELLHHATELRALGAVAYGANEIGAISDSEHAIALRAIRVTLESSLVTEFISGLSIGLVAMVVGFALLGGRITLDHALIAVLATSELFGFVRRFGSQFHRREDAAASLDVLLGGPSPELARTTGPLVAARGLVTTARTLPLTLDILPSSRTLITGPSGSGKTTLLHTLVGWRVPLAGSVHRTAGRVGYVSVESALFADSLRTNLTLGRDIDDDRLHEQLSDLALTGPRFSDLSCELLADGRGFSSGERVRLVLARCLLAEPNLLILDDIAGVLDQAARTQVTHVLTQQAQLAVVEATVDRPLLALTPNVAIVRT